jgi:hypothetical protein
MAWENREGRGSYFTHTLRLGKKFVRLYFGKGLAAKFAALRVELQNRRTAKSLRDESDWWRELRKLDRRSSRVLEHLGRLPEPGGSPESNAEAPNISEVA